jgi:hypothetical protein
MRRLVFLFAILGALALGSGPLVNESKIQAAPTERAVVEFNQTVRLLNVFLRGRYVVVHDDSRMAEGKPCLSVYSYNDPDKLVTAFHCKPVERDKVESFTIRTARGSWFELPEVLEIQFAGANKAHQVP